jgi:hypothetical protein
LPASTEPHDVLTRCAELIQERGRTHGDYAENMATIAALWSAFLGIKILPHQVPIMLGLVKAARMRRDGTADFNLDNYEDFVAYGAIATAIVKKAPVK